MNHNFQEVILQATGADSLYHIEDIQSLWSGYGKIMRYGLRGVDRDRVVIKHVKLPDQHHHPRGWSTDRSHQRKIRSYQVETAWYRDWASHCDDRCRVPVCLALEADADEFLMVFEDLDASGFPVRKSAVSQADMQLCLNWLAQFHATFMGETPSGLWETGSYWHLDTRPDELEALEDIELKHAAGGIDALLRAGRFQTFIHGDAKLANFCFSADGTQVAAVDFQYVGGGCGMKDVAYFIGSCLYEEACERHEDGFAGCLFQRAERRARKSRPGCRPAGDRAGMAWLVSCCLDGLSPFHERLESGALEDSQLQRAACPASAGTIEITSERMMYLSKQHLDELLQYAVAAARQAGAFIQASVAGSRSAAQKRGQ